MPKVISPFFSGWASGTFGKVITCYWIKNNGLFRINMKKMRSGKRTEQQEQNAKIFGEHARMVAIARKNFAEE